jgi:uncharacterized RDD family membrane protein YckC
MNESPTRTLDDEEQEKIPSANLEPAPLFKRIIAFAMDFILIILLLQLMAHFLPNFWDNNTQNEFKSLLQQATLLAQESQMNSEEMSRFIDQSGLSPETYEMLMAMVVWACFLPILYFFIGERFFFGKSLGKATFGLRTVRMDGTDIPPSPFRQFFRAAGKGLSALILITPFLLPGLMNFLFCFLNRQRRCLHDMIGGTITIQEINKKEVSE